MSPLPRQTFHLETDATARENQTYGSITFCRQETLRGTKGHPPGWGWSQGYNPHFLTSEALLTLLTPPLSFSVRIIFPLLFPQLSTGPKAPRIWFVQCVFSCLPRQPSEASGFALVVMIAVWPPAPCCHQAALRAVGEPQSKQPCWPPFLPEDVCCVQVLLWLPPPLLMCQHIAEW